MLPQTGSEVAEVVGVDTVELEGRVALRKIMLDAEGEVADMAQTGETLIHIVVAGVDGEEKVEMEELEVQT